MSHQFDSFPVLHTLRLDLVEIVPAHAADLFGIFTDKRVTAYYPVVPLHEERDILPVIERFRNQYHDRLGIRWGITLKGQQQLIGSIGFQYFTTGHKGGIAYALSPDYWVQGYISEALKAVIQFGFDELELRRIEAEVIPGNVASDKVLTRNGFQHEGLLRQWMQWDGRYYDVNMYSVLKC